MTYIIAITLMEMLLLYRENDIVSYIIPITLMEMPLLYSAKKN